MTLRRQVSSETAYAKTALISLLRHLKVPRRSLQRFSRMILAPISPIILIVMTRRMILSGSTTRTLLVVSLKGTTLQYGMVVTSAMAMR